MSSSDSQVNPALLFDIQALAQLNETSRKEMEKRQDEIRIDNANADEVLQEEISQDAAFENSKAQGSKQDQIKDVIKSMPSQAGKMSKNSKKTATDQTSKTNTDTAKSVLNTKQTKALVGTLMDLTTIKESIKASNMPEMELDFDHGRVLDQILDRKNLMGCKASDAQLKKAKAQAKRMARTMRHALKAALPSVSNAAAKAYAQKGVDVSNPTAANPNSASTPNPSVDSSIISSMLAALNMNELLQKLGINAEIDELNFEHDMSTSLVAEAQKQFQANADQIQEAKHKSCLSKTLTILGDVVGAIFCWLGNPEIGVPIILAANGIIAKGIAALAKAMGISDYVVQSIIVALTIIALTIANIASDGALTPMMAITIALFVAGMVGWVDTTLGEIATHSDDPSKWPSWVTWASMGINIGIGLLTMGESVLSLIRTMGQMMAKFAGFVAENAGELLDSVMSSTASLTDTADVAEAEMAEMNQISSVRATPEIAETNIDEAASVNAGSTPGAPAATEGAASSSSQATTASAQGSSSATSGSNGSLAAQESAGNAASSQASSSASPANAQGSSVQNSGVVGAVNSQSLVTAAIDGQVTNESAMANAIGASGRADAPEAYSESARAETTEEGAKTPTEKKLSFLQKALRTMLEKLMNMQKALGSALQDDASELAGMLRGAETAAQKAERIAQLIERMIMLSQRVGRWLLLASQGAQSAVQYEMSECDKELAVTIKEVADATAEVTLYEQFVATFNMAVSTTEDNEKEYATDMSDELKLVGEIISAQRRNNNMLMTA